MEFYSNYLKKVILQKNDITLFRVSLCWAAHGWGESKKAPLPKICHSYLTMMKLGTFISHIKKIQKTYKSRDIPLAFC